MIPQALFVQILTPMAVKQDHPLANSATLCLAERVPPSSAVVRMALQALRKQGRLTVTRLQVSSTCLSISRKVVGIVHGSFRAAMQMIPLSQKNVITCLSLLLCQPANSTSLHTTYVHTCTHTHTHTHTHTRTHTHTHTHAQFVHMMLKCVLPLWLRRARLPQST